MQKLMLFGKDLENLIDLIVSQKQFNNSLDASELYEEINSKINELEGFSIVTSLKDLGKNPPIEKIYQSNNFKYLLSSPYLIVINKFH